MMTSEKIEKDSVQDIFELSTTQKGILFHYLEDPGSNLYNVQLSLEIRGDLDISRLKAAIETTQSQNEVLRSVFRWEQVNRPLQIILKTCPFDFRFKQVPANSSEPAGDVVRQWAEHDLNERFDITKLPLRFTVIEVSHGFFFLNITYHHILLDGWSNAILVKEIVDHYRRQGGGDIPDFAPKPAYNNVRKIIQAGYAPDNIGDYWAKYLEGYQIVPLFAETAGVGSGKRRNKKIRISSPIGEIESFTRRFNVTKASVIYAAYGILLQKYCNTSDVVFGVAVANRDESILGIENVMGNFIDTIPLRLSKQGILADIVTGVYTGLLEGRDYSHTSYATIKRIMNLKPAEDLFDSVLVVENYPMDRNMFDMGSGLSIRLDSFYESVDVPLLVNAFMGEELVLEFTFNEAKVDATVLRSFAGHLLNIINSITARPLSKSENVAMLSPDERTRLIYEFNDTQEKNPEEETIVTLFEEQVKRTPERIALIDRHHTLTYGELNEKSNRLAGRLLRMGVEKGDIIGVMMPRQKEMLIGILGALKMGCAYLPIDPDYPIARINYILKDSNPAFLLTTESLRNVYSQINADVGIYMVADDEPGGTGAPDLGIDFPSSRLAYLIYTSGTTGVPKGIMIEHRNVVNYVRAIADRVHVGIYRSILCLTTVSFDIFVTETIVPLLNGLTIVLADAAKQKDPYALAGMIIAHDVDLMQMTPSHLNLLLNAQRDDYLDCLKAILVGGEALPHELLTKLSSKFRGKIYNMYGPTETTVWSACQDLTGKSAIDIGRPIRNTSLYVLDHHRNLQPVGIPGELFIGGSGLARGYWKNERLTKEKFIGNPFIPGERIYGTGDLAYRQPDGSIKILGRLDSQVKVRGFRVELGEIEANLLAFEFIKEAAVVVREKGADKFIAAYYISDHSILPGEFKRLLAAKLPDYMIPSYFVRLERLPLTPNGKIDRKALPEPEIHRETDQAGPSNATEQKLIAIWSELLGHKDISVNMNFFDIGGDSLKLIAASNLIRKEFDREISINDLFEHPTIVRLSGFLTRTGEIKEGSNKERSGSKQKGGTGSTDIAVIGIACRFPGAADGNEFWALLKNGREGISRNEPGDNGSMVYAKGFLQESDCFDSSFFNYTPAEAEAMDPQMRVFHECVYAALEDAGYAPSRFEGRIGLYAGATANPYYNVSVTDIPSEDWAEKWDEITYTDKDFLCSRVSYKLNLKGPSLNINTACSTSLAAVDKACGELLSGKCEMAIAGGVSITLHDNKGYFYHKDMILSPDGTCRAFDEKSSGTVGGNGAGVVVLKCLDGALQDGDFIYAVIKGTATNNDGSDKVGFTAPSINGQSAVIETALENAGIEPESISCIEAHGTGTALGDPVEIAALTKAFKSDKRQFCAIGSVKTNIGHLDAAAGIAGLIKVVYALKHKQIPPSLHFRKPNPNIDFANSPFFVNTGLLEWPEGGSPRRAGVSSFGIGGTNVHVVVEEAPAPESNFPSRKYQVLTLSAKSEKALRGNIRQLIDSLRDRPEFSLADIAYTLNLGREQFGYRKAVICHEAKEAIDLLEAFQNTKFKALASGRREIVLMFPGLGSQYRNMLAGIYEAEPYFRNIADECFAIAKGSCGIDLKELLFPGHGSSDGLSEIDDIQNAHPALFIVEYSLARLLMSWGIRPDLMIGHSVGEYVAACISGVFSLEDALQLVIVRSRLIQQSRRGKMLAVSIPEQDLLPLLRKHGRISLAAVNSSELCVVSGEDGDISAFQDIVEAKGFSSQLVRTSHASHSYMMEDIRKEFEEVVRRVKINHPKIPFVSNLTGTMATYEEISDPAYWSKHLSHTVRFSAGVSLLMGVGNRLFVEAGPGNTLGTFVRSNGDYERTNKVIYTVRHEEKTDDDMRYLLSSIGKIWMYGFSPDWHSFYAKETRKRVPLPTYSFDRIQYPTRSCSPQPADNRPQIKSSAITDWIYTPSWEVFSSVDATNVKGGENNILFVDRYGIGAGLHRKLTGCGEKMIEVVPGSAFHRKNSGFFEINPDLEEDYIRLFSGIGDKGACRVIFTWGIEVEREGELSVDGVKAGLEKYFYRLLKVARALAGIRKGKIELITITNNANYVLTGDSITPGKESLLAALKVIRKEYKSIACRNIDIGFAGNVDEALIDDLFLEIGSRHRYRSVAYRHRTRFVESFKSIAIPGESHIPFESGGVYLITGGTGGIGLSISKRIVEAVRGVRLILAGRKKLPSKDLWKSWLLSPENKSSEIYTIVEAMEALEAAGGVIHYCSVDMEDAEGLKRAIASAESEVGKIRGVIHAAGIADYAGIIFHRTRAENEKVFSPKIYGTILLNETLSNHKLDFFVLCSSISTALPIEGQVGYVAANMFLNAFARYNFRYHNVNTISIGWNAWRDVGFAVKAQKEGNADVLSELNSISPDQGYELLLRSIGNRLPESLISRFDVSEIRTRRESDSESADGSNLQNETGSSPDLYSELPSLVNKMTEVWKKLLGVAEINPTDDFFEIGGNSLKALTIIGRIRKVFNVEISIKEIFNNSTLAALCDHVYSMNRSADGREKEAGVRRAESKDAYPLSSGQKRLYFLYTFDKSSLAYNVPIVYKLTGTLDKARLSSTFSKLIARHESLRTSIQLVNGVLYQVISDVVDFEVEIIDAGHGGPVALPELFMRPFDLTSAPLIRAGLVRTSAEEHLLLIDMHHIIADGVSEGILMTDFMAIYNDAELPVLTLQYKDYTEWQQSDLQQKDLAAQKEFWLKEFEDEFTILDLPTDYARPEVLTFKGASIDFELDPASVAGLKVIAEKEGATLFMILLSVLNILLSRLSNQEDIIIGTTIANRRHADFEEIIGMFVNTLALRNFPHRQMSFRQFLSAVKTRTLACFDNQSYPYEDLVEELDIERDTGRNALFDAVFVLYNTESVDLSIPDLAMEPYRMQSKISKFDITLSARESGGGILLNFEYATSLFRKETIERFIGYFQKIVSAVCANIDTKIGDIDILTEMEKDRLLWKLNDTQTPYPPDKTVMTLFEEQVVRKPAKTAVVYGRIQLSYKELNERANRLAAYLQERHAVGRDELVGLCMDRSEFVPIVILAVLKAGGAYVPMDPDFPDDRIGYVVRDTGMRVVLTNEEHVPRLEGILADCRQGVRRDGRAVAVGIDGSLFRKQTLAAYSPDIPGRNTTQDDLAYVIYTSGTTGRPKGVMVEHRGIVNLALTQENIYSPGNSGNEVPHRNCLWYSNYVFDAHVWEIYTTLICGHTLYILENNARSDIRLLQEYVRQYAIDVATIPPALLDREHILELKTLIVAGETTSAWIMEKYTQQGINVINAYGPTEVTVCSTFRHYRTGDSNRNIGRPISNATVYVLDAERRVLPEGVAGELYIGGAGIARGYLGQPELTADRFFINPFQSENERMEKYNGRLYRTGDLVRYHAGGDLEYIGRNDFQIKIRGYRIELGEIESRLSSVPGVRQAVVIVREREAIDKYLVGYYVSDQPLPADEIINHLRERLPEYMIPSFFIHLSELPLTVNGKLDRKALPEFQMEADSGENVPAGELEDRLMDVWAELLGTGRDKISINRSFFQSGGNSILLVRLNSILNERFNCAVSIPDLFRYSTITALAGKIRDASPHSGKEMEEVVEETEGMKSVIGNLFNDNE